MKKITAYECEYGCGKYLKTKASIIKHEITCFYNPDRKACQSCGHNTVDSVTIYNPSHGGDPGSTDYEQQIRFCAVKDTDLFDKDNLKYDCFDWTPKG